MHSEGYSTWSVCVSVSQSVCLSTLISYLVQLCDTSDFSVRDMSSKVKKAKCLATKLERYV